MPQPKAGYVYLIYHIDRQELAYIGYDTRNVRVVYQELTDGMFEHKPRFAPERVASLIGSSGGRKKWQFLILEEFSLPERKPIKHLISMQAHFIELFQPLLNVCKPKDFPTFASSPSEPEVEQLQSVESEI